MKGCTGRKAMLLRLLYHPSRATYIERIGRKNNINEVKYER